MLKLSTDEIREHLKKAMEPDEIIYHPDTNFTYAAYQINVGKFEVWLNARNGDVITMQGKINRF